MKTGPWSDAEDDLGRGYAKTLSFFKVAKLLDRSRNAVIGRARREGWNCSSFRKVSTVKVTEVYPRTTSNQIKTERHGPVKYANLHSPPPLDPEIEPHPVTAMKLIDARDSDCRFVCGDPRNMIVCGAKTLPGRSWCSAHAAQIYGVYTKTVNPASPKIIEE